ncbi:hypothetical protein TNCV_1210041 [Trichonephila clavipes]|nr:hypothetical protein TNCV_1210041 [Trichonephila clavipes]
MVDNMIAKSPNWSPKITPTWLYRQDFAKFPLNHHYNVDSRTRRDPHRGRDPSRPMPKDIPGVGVCLGQEKMLATPCDVLSQLQESPPQDELYDFWHYPVLKERDRQWLQRKVRHGVLESRLHTFEPSNCHSV